MSIQCNKKHKLNKIKYSEQPERKICYIMTYEFVNGDIAFGCTYIASFKLCIILCNRISYVLKFLKFGDG